jgi:hypothetical protein
MGSRKCARQIVQRAKQNAPGRCVNKKKAALPKKDRPFVFRHSRLFSRGRLPTAAAGLGIASGLAGALAARVLAATAAEQARQQAATAAVTTAAAVVVAAAGRLGSASRLGVASGLAGALAARALAAAAVEQTRQQATTAAMTTAAAVVIVAAGRLGSAGRRGVASGLGSATALLGSAAAATAEQAGFGVLGEEDEDGQRGQREEQTSHETLLGQREVNGESRQDFVNGLRPAPSFPFTAPQRFQIVPKIPRGGAVTDGGPGKLAGQIPVRSVARTGRPGGLHRLCGVLAGGILRKRGAQTNCSSQAIEAVCGGHFLFSTRSG